LAYFSISKQKFAPGVNGSRS